MAGVASHGFWRFDRMGIEFCRRIAMLVTPRGGSEISTGPCVYPATASATK